MKILAVETSCDDTGIAVLDIKGTKNPLDFDVLSNIVSSQIEVHRPYGGVYPMLAKREHLKNLPIVLKRAFKEAKISSPEKEIDLITVTQGPGLEPCLWTGVNFTKELSKAWNIPIVPVNHIESHILVNYLERKKINFPAIALVVSGGHTQLILIKKVGQYKILGETRDDAAGECFDKCAKILGLGYPGGPEIAKLATESRTPLTGGVRDSANSAKYQIPKLPRPMINTKDYDFSFSGLKTAVLYGWDKIKKDIKMDDRQFRCKKRVEMATEIQQAIIDVLIKKTMRAVRDYKVKTLILGGGVSANKELRRQFEEKIGTDAYGFLPRGKKPYKTTLLYPNPKFSTDNAVMTAIAAYFHRNKTLRPGSKSWKALRPNANLRIGKIMIE